LVHVDLFAVLDPVARRIHVAITLGLGVYAVTSRGLDGIIVCTIWLLISWTTRVGWIRLATHFLFSFAMNTLF
jgi:hypothetical protein